LTVSLNSYIDGFPTEFDLIIHNASAKAKMFTHAFEPNYVYGVIEVKAAGLFSKDIVEAASKIKRNFDMIRTEFAHIRCCYLTVREVTNPKKSTSKNFAVLTRKGLGSYPFFCLSDSRSREPIPNEWENFLKSLELK
jgi:hypothetical protein